MGSTDNQSHQLAFQVKNEQLGGNVGKETSCFLLEMGEPCHLLHQVFFFCEVSVTIAYRQRKQEEACNSLEQ